MQLMLTLVQQRDLFLDVSKVSEDAVKASFEISKIIAESSKPFTDGLFIKQYLLKVADELCPDKKTCI